MEKKSFINSSNLLQRIVSRMSTLWFQFSIQFAPKWCKPLELTYFILIFLFGCSVPALWKWYCH